MKEQMDLKAFLEKWREHIPSGLRIEFVIDAADLRANGFEVAVVAIMQEFPEVSW